MTQAAKSAARPLSPHLQVYRLPLAAWLSITHRITGVGLTIGTVLLTWWVVAAAYGPDAYGRFQGFISSPIGYLFLFGFSASLFYHLCNGIRHLLWDVGKNFEIAQTNRANMIVIAGALVLTAIAWFLALR
jgi:succinate dehydrogenase / fumarate reductase cytochrome b subunit